MISLAYASAATKEFNKDMLVDLHDQALGNNRKHGITGYLSWKNGRFFQYLEGPENAVTALMDKISRDTRHKVLQVLSLGTIEQRRFLSWDMLNMTGAGIPDIRIADLIEDVMNSTIGKVFAESESQRMVIEMLDQMSKLHREIVLRKNPSSSTLSNEGKPLFIVAFGASAGGLQPLQNIVRNLTQRKDCAYIVIQHLAPDAETVMDMILQRETKMTVCAAADNMLIEPGCVYVIPPGDDLEVDQGRFVLYRQQRANHGPQYPVDICFRSIAREFGDHAIAVVLSGTGSDGSRGAKVLNESGGIVLAQLPQTAEFDGMPKALIETGMVHQILAPPEIAEFINSVDIERVHETLALVPEKRADYVNEIVTLLEDGDIDFSQYKNETLYRRIERRRILTNSDTEEDYIDLLRSSEAERFQLRDDILITVTSFFRDADAWANLSKTLESAIDELRAGDVFRVWVTACSSGEEAYSAAIILTEIIEKSGKDVSFKIYATDIERKALEFAGIGCYPARAMENVGEQRRKRFFSTRPDGYVINREVRENVIFAPHNFIKNAPFTRMHLVTCRNVLIYMQPELQQIAIKMLHFALNVNGLLFLGPSESLGSLQSEFFPVQREWNLHKKLRNLRLPLHLTSERFREASKVPVTTRDATSFQKPLENNNVVGIALGALSRHYGNTNVLIDNHRSVMMLVADPSGLMHMPAGEPSLDIVNLIPENLRPSMTFAISRAFKEEKVVKHNMLPCEPVGQHERMVDIEVVPYLHEGADLLQYALVVISDSVKDESAVVSKMNAEDKKLVEELKAELEETKSALLVAIRDLESSNDGQRTINEQLSAANEELQSTNEELQSVNEELYTVNFEYQTKIHELSDLNQDLDNLLDSTNLGVVFLDSDLNIRRFTDFATHTVNLLPSDIGRPFSDLAHNLSYNNLMSDLRRVLSIGKSATREICKDNDDHLQVGIHPYRAGQGMAQGVLITFRDIKTKPSPEEADADHDLDTAF
ncbi:MAG: chemotaxis protein CheB [Granulosicoccus sp.]